MIYHPHSVDTQTFSCDAVAGISVECAMDCISFSVFHRFSVFSRQLSDLSEVARLLHGMKETHVEYLSWQSVNWLKVMYV